LNVELEVRPEAQETRQETEAQSPNRTAEGELVEER
jgi:hypothetical protein